MSLEFHSYSGARKISMATRNVVLTVRQEQLIEALVQSGRYQNASEVVREGLRLVERREAEDAAKLAALRAATQEGLDDLAQGRFKEFSDVQQLTSHLRQ